MPTFYTKQFFKPNWTDTRKAQTLNFEAGEDIPAKAFVKRDPIDPSKVFIWTGTGTATGYNLSQRDVKAGCRLDVVIDGYDLEGETGGLGGGSGGSTDTNCDGGGPDTVYTFAEVCDEGVVT